MIAKDFALFGNVRSVFVNEEPDRFNPYLLKLGKKEEPKPAATAAKMKPAFDICSVSSDSSDDNAIIIIKKERSPAKPVPRFSQEGVKQI
jgi:hypothetical protein